MVEYGSVAALTRGVGHEFEQTLGDSKEQGSLAYCSS